MISRAPLIALCLLLTGCADFPEVGRAEANLTNPGTTPPLLTSDQLARATGAPVIDKSAALSGDVARLRARADRLRRR